MDEAEKQQELEKADIRCIMRLEGGRRFIHKLLTQSGVAHDVFDVNPHQHAYNAGQRANGVMLNNMVAEAAPEYYLQMNKEHLDG